MLIAAALLFIQCIYAQELPLPFLTKDVEKLEKMVLKQYKRDSHQSVDNVHLFNVYDVACDNRDIRETFADTSFISKLVYGYVRVKCRRYLAAVSVVCDSDYKIVGEWHWNEYSNHAVFFDQSFMDTLNMRQLVQVYRVREGLKDPFLIGVTKDCKTCLIDSQQYGYKVYPIIDLSDMQWKQILAGHPKLEIDTSHIPKLKIPVPDTTLKKKPIEINKQ